MLEPDIEPAREVRERWVDRARPAAILIAIAAVVIARSAVLVFWPAAHFDSDQAVMGLMAKHLSEGRAFPVFLYGQSYILGVQAWMAAPLFLIAGVSVTALKLPLLAVNVAVALLLVRLFEKECGLRPAFGALAAAPFILPAPGTTARLLEASGGNPELFLSALLVWMTRRRAWLCGAIFGVAFLQREFTIYALLALLLMWALDGTLRSREGAVRLGKMMAAAAAIWVGVQGLRLLSSAAGPGTTTADLAGQPNNLMEIAARTCVAPGTLAKGAGLLVTQHWPQLFGAAPYPLTDFGIESRVAQGLAWSSLLPAAAVAIAVAGIVTAGRSRNRALATSVCAYLTMIGLFSVGGYVAGRCGELSFYTMRYELLSILGVVGLGAWFLAVQQSRLLLGTWIAAVAAWTMVTGVPHARLLTEYLTQPPVAAKQIVVRALEADGVRYGSADYWIAYYVTFMTGERIVLASTDLVRIRSYQDVVREHQTEAVRLSRQPCAGGRELVRGVYRCP